MSLVTCCRDAMGLLTEASEGKLSGAQKTSHALHMLICVRCKRYRAQLGTTVEVLRAMPRPQEEPKAETIDAILRKIADG
jgi:hypothetical protein